MPIFLLSLLIFLTPFIINPFFGYFFEPPKVIFAEILIELILFVTFFKKGFLKSFKADQLLLSVILFILTIIHLILIKNSQIFFGNEFRLQGIFLLWHLLVLSILSSKLNINKLPAILFPISLVFLLLTSLLVEPDINGRAIGTLGEANALASSAIFFYPFILKFRHQKKLRKIILNLGIFFITLVIILLSGSRSGMVAFLVQVIFLILTRFLTIKKSVIITIFLIVLSLYLPFIEGGGWFENRSEIWRTALSAGSQHILGNGFGNIEQTLSIASENLRNNVRFQSVDSSHNFLLDFWVQGGAVGLSVMIVLILLSLEGLIKKFKIVEITTLLGLICVMLFNPVSVTTLVSFWFILGQGFEDSQMV